MGKTYYTVSSYQIQTIGGKRGGVGTKTLWRVSEGDTPDARVKRILKDGFGSKEAAEEYLDLLYSEEPGDGTGTYDV